MNKRIGVVLVLAFVAVGCGLEDGKKKSSDEQINPFDVDGGIVLNVDTINVDEQNVDHEDVDVQNVDEQNVDTQNVDESNVDVQNVDEQNVDTQNTSGDAGTPDAGSDPECGDGECNGEEDDLNCPEDCEPLAPKYMPAPLMAWEACNGDSCDCTVGVYGGYALDSECVKIETSLPGKNGSFITQQTSEGYFLMTFKPSELSNGTVYDLTYYSSQTCNSASFLGAPEYGNESILACLSSADRTPVWCTWDTDEATRDYCGLKVKAVVYTNANGKTACKFEGAGNMGGNTPAESLKACGMW